MFLEVFNQRRCSNQPEKVFNPMQKASVVDFKNRKRPQN
jgi:hypothetical protein